MTQKAFNYGLRPIVVINKVDRDSARIDAVIDEVFDLFVQLGASDEQLDFPVVYASALQGFATLDMSEKSDDLAPLLDVLVDKVPAPSVDEAGPFQMQISTLDYSSYLGMIGIGRVQRGAIKVATPVRVIDREGQERSAKIAKLFTFQGLERTEVKEVVAGDIVAVTGVDPLSISDTLCDVTCVEALPPLTVDEPTMSMTFQVNDSPLAGREGKFVTSRQIQARLEKETLSNVALKVTEMDRPDQFRVSGRGELHLSVLIETMRREGYEFAVCPVSRLLNSLANLSRCASPPDSVGALWPNEI